VALHVDDEVVAEGPMRTQPGFFSPSRATDGR
jgi:hypothetical protein